MNSTTQINDISETFGLLYASIPEGVKAHCDIVVIHIQDRFFNLFLPEEFRGKKTRLVVGEIPTSHHKRRIGYIRDGKELHINL